MYGGQAQDAETTTRSFFCQDQWDYLSGGGCVWARAREATSLRRGLTYQSHRAAGRMELGVSNWQGLTFCSKPSTKISWKDHQTDWFVMAPSPPSGLVTSESRCWRCSRGFEPFQLLDSHTAGWSHSTSSRAHKMQCSLHWLSKTHTNLPALTSASSHQR